MQALLVHGLQQQRLVSMIRVIQQDTTFGISLSRLLTLAYHCVWWFGRTPEFMVVPL